MNIDFWRNRRVFLTGHTGFKGSWLSLWLQSMGVNLTGYALSPPTTPSLFEVAGVGEGMNSIIGDVRNLELLKFSIQEAQPEIIIHMAAQPLVLDSYIDPVSTYSTNVMGTVNLLEAVRQTSGIRAVVNVTTDQCYENRKWVGGYRDNDPMGGYDPSSNSKGCSELVTSGFRSSFFNPDKYSEHGVAIATARAGNVIGGGDWAKDRLIPDILNSFSSGQTALIRNPNSTRPWQHVLEPLLGYLMLSEALCNSGAEYVGPWNFGPNDEDAREVQWIVENMADKWQDDVSWKVDQDPYPHEASYLKLDTSKARQALCWSPKLNLNQALELVVDWAKFYKSGGDIRKFTLSQIYKYQEIKTRG